jgi:hypothetical protein
MIKNRNRVTISKLSPTLVSWFHSSAEVTYLLQNKLRPYKKSYSVSRWILEVAAQSHFIPYISYFPSGIFSKRVGVFYSILAILQVASLLYITYHVFSPSSLPTFYPRLPFSRTTLLLIFRSITLHSRWPPRTVSHWLKEQGGVINHCPKVKENGWTRKRILEGVLDYKNTRFE